MADYDFFKFILTAGLASLIGGGAGFAIIVFLSKKLIDQLLKKDIEKFKTELSCRLKLDQEISKFNYDKEVKIIREIWEHIEHIVTLCAKFEENKDEEQLNSLNRDLKNNLSKNIPFIHNNLEAAIVELIELSNIESFSPNKFDKIAKSRNEIISIIRDRLHLF